MISATERIATLRRRCIERKHLVNYQDTACASARSLRESEGIVSWQVRRGLLTRDRLLSMRFAVDNLELLMGRLAPKEHEDKQERETADEYLKSYKWPGGQTGHCELDRSRIFKLGIANLRDDLRARRDASAGRQADVYQSFMYALEGFGGMIENAAAAARAAMDGASERRKRELQMMAESCERIAHEPPQSFRDAIQLLWLMDMGTTTADNAGLTSPGHLDRTLLPFYQADRAAGVLSHDDALLLIESLYLLTNEFVPDGLAMAVMVGGRDVGGCDATNELSYLCGEALRRTKLVYPTVGICWHEKTPVDLVDLGVELIGKGYANMAFFGDDTIQRGLALYGAPPDDACNYINSTCVEITPAGASNVWVASPYFPLPTILLAEMGEQVKGDAAADFDEFVRRYHQRLGEHIACGVEDQNRTRLDRQCYGGKPLQSVFTRDCISRGRDIDDGGAAYNWVECSFVGLANLADSLYVIREEVFNSGRLSLSQMKGILDTNFEGHEAERLRLLQKLPKYGNDVSEVDELVDATVAFIREECAKHKMEPDGSHFVPGTFCWIMHERLGGECGATPDGRKAGFPFADGAGPAQGREKNGPTASILSTTSWDHAPMIGGLAYNMKFNSSLFSLPGAYDRLRDLILTFLRRGGFETQINVVSLEALQKARENPDAYRDLVVRIGGYTDYFTRLSNKMQEEVMMRTAYEQL